MTYTRTLGRGFTLDDPDVIAFTSTMVGAVLYVVYNIQINMHPEEYDTNSIYTYGDIMYFVGACFYVLAALRDDHWFWFLPMGGQYGVPPGKVHVETKRLPQFGKPVVLMTDCFKGCCKRCCKRSKIKTANVNQHDQVQITHL